MFALFLCILVLFLFVSDSSTVISGASYGLMLWYNNVLPILLPFMLLSGIIVRQVGELASSAHKTAARSSLIGILTTLLLGVLCGYPLGAKTAADFVREDIYDTSVGNLLIPLCNNSSPMFISGYIVYTILQNKISFFSALLAIYAPYIIFVLIGMTIIHLRKGRTACVYSDMSRQKRKGREKQDGSVDYMQNAVLQITYVGIYIMLCSILIFYIQAAGILPNLQTALLSGIIEITNGTHRIAQITELSSHIKTALILAATSFGGISAILQTNKVISASGLSIIFYIAVKTICAAGTFLFVLLLV